MHILLWPDGHRKKSYDDWINRRIKKRDHPQECIMCFLINLRKEEKRSRTECFHLNQANTY